MKPTSYVYFQRFKIKMPLYNSNDYEVDLGNGTALKIPPHQERLLALLFYYPPNFANGKRFAHQWLSNAFQNFPLHLQDIFIDNFVKDHPVSHSEHEDIPLQAIDGVYSFCMIGLGANETETISAEHEKELVEILKNSNQHNARHKVTKWFANYYFARGINIFTSQDHIKLVSRNFIEDKGAIWMLEMSTADLFGGLSALAIGAAYLFVIFGVIMLFVIMFC